MGFLQALFKSNISVKNKDNSVMREWELRIKKVGRVEKHRLQQDQPGDLWPVNKLHSRCDSVPERGLIP